MFFFFYDLIILTIRSLFFLYSVPYFYDIIVTYKVNDLSYRHVELYTYIIVVHIIILKINYYVTYNI